MRWFDAGRTQVLSVGWPSQHTPEMCHSAALGKHLRARPNTQDIADPRPRTHRVQEWLGVLLNSGPKLKTERKRRPVQTEYVVVSSARARQTSARSCACRPCSCSVRVSGTGDIESESAVLAGRNASLVGGPERARCWRRCLTGAALYRGRWRSGPRLCVVARFRFRVSGTHGSCQWRTSRKHSWDASRRVGSARGRIESASQLCTGQMYSQECLSWQKSAA
ncbi:hypothetical protein B0H10DRAFT_1248952 [Mycena sp. CBHHK59/15]|nr:hypothetical protein B0H10DRAFT_1248952 [Mycena sp. CBHHK59/15]